MITINNKYDSSDLLFSIPVHERQDIINNTVENIFNFNPNSKIILHINKTFTSFDKNLSNYKNLYFNQSNINYIKGGDLLAYHISNFNYCLNNNINFEYFIFCASNELFIKKGSVNYINSYKNGIQIINDKRYDDWHNFKKNIENNELIMKLFNTVNIYQLYGGQAEGQFFQKHIFKKISDLYLDITNNNEHFIEFEAEEIIPQIIFKSMDIDYNDPITLQNYTNNIDFNINFIKQIINGTIINDYTIKNQLISPHVKKSTTNVYSIKRVDRNFNSIRQYLTNKGFILNNDEYNFDTFYYSNNSSLFINNNYEINFKKNVIGFKDFQWFGYFLKKGYYYIHFEYKTNTFINQFSNCGLKLHHPYNYTISNFFNNKSNEYTKVSIPIINKHDQDIIFIFDDYLNTLDINFKNIEFENNIILQNKKKNIILLFFKNNNNKTQYFDNTQLYLIDIFKNIYNVYILIILNTKLNNEKYIMKNFNPHYVFYKKKIDFKTIIECSNQFIKEFELNFQFIFISNIDLIYLQNISNSNLIINKLNFLSYISLSNNYDVNYNLCIIPFQYLEKLIKINNENILKYIYENYIDFNLLINNFYDNNNKIVYINNIKQIINENGFLFDSSFLSNILYYNNFCYFKKININHYYFYKKQTTKYEDFLWCGHLLKFSEENNSNINIKISFEINLHTKFIKQENVGLKIHYPLIIYHEILDKVIINKFTEINIDINILKKNQLIILNFDYYLPEIEFEIRNFKIIHNNNS